MAWKQSSAPLLWPTATAATFYCAQLALVNARTALWALLGYASDSFVISRLKHKGAAISRSGTVKCWAPFRSSEVSCTSWEAFSASQDQASREGASRCRTCFSSSQESAPPGAHCEGQAHFHNPREGGRQKLGAYMTHFPRQLTLYKNKCLSKS